jgi:hypothetical protein
VLDFVSLAVLRVPSSYFFVFLYILYYLVEDGGGQDSWTSRSNNMNATIITFIIINRQRFLSAFVIHSRIPQGIITLPYRTNDGRELHRIISSLQLRDLHLTGQRISSSEDSTRPFSLSAVSAFFFFYEWTFFFRAGNTIMIEAHHPLLPSSIVCAILFLKKSTRANWQ